MTSSNSTSSPTEEIAAYSLSTDFSKLPADVVDRTKRIIADEISCMIMGSAMEPGEVATAFVASLGGVGQSTVIGGGISTLAPYAALVNGTSAHSDEMDGTHLSGGHPGGPALAGALAIVESRNLTGPDLINAVVLSYDIGCRLSMAMGGGNVMRDENHTYGAALFALGIAASSGRLLQLQQLQIQHALSLAMLNISIPASFYEERKHMSKSLNQGQMAFAGVTGALLASHNFEAHDTVIEAKHGIIDQWKTSLVDLSLLTADFGTDYMVMKAGFKYFSAGYPIHSPLAGALALMTENDLKPDDIAVVRVGLAPYSADTVDSRAMPSISLQYMLSLGMVLGQLTHADAHNETLYERPDVARLRNCIEIIRDETISLEDLHRRVSWVEFVTTDGRTIRGQRRTPPGHWEDGGMSWDHLEKKFASLVAPVMGSETSNAIWSLLEKLENLEDLQPLTTLLRGTNA